MAEFHERRDEQRESFREQRILDGEGARDVHGALGVPGLRQSRWEHFDRLSEMDEASGTGCVLRRDGAERGTVQTDEYSDPDNYGTLRWRSAGRVHILQAAHAVRDRAGPGQSLPDYRAVGSRGNAHTESGSGRTEIWPSKLA